MNKRFLPLLIIFLFIGSVSAAAFNYVLIEFYKPGGLSTDLTPEQAQELQTTQESQQYFSGLFSTLNCHGVRDCAEIKTDITKYASTYAPQQCSSKMSSSSFALLLYYQIQQESNFDKMDVNKKSGARGLCQFMPGSDTDWGVYNPFDIDQSVRGQAKYMRWLMQTFHCDYRLALAGYNDGQGNVIAAGNQIPQNKETIDYVRKISANYESAVSRA